MKLQQSMCRRKQIVTFFGKKPIGNIFLQRYRFAICSLIFVFSRNMSTDRQLIVRSSFPFHGTTKGELSYLAPLGSENISASYFKQCFFRGGITPQTVKHHASQSQDRNNKYFILYIWILHQ